MVGSLPLQLPDIHPTIWKIAVFKAFYNTLERILEQFYFTGLITNSDLRG